MWQSIGRFLGGAVFFAAVAAAASLLSDEVSLANSLVFAAAFGAALVQPVHTRFLGEPPFMERVSTSGHHGLLANLCTGIKVAMVRGVLFGIPCSVAASVVLSAALAMAASFIDGSGIVSEFLARLSAGFWICGLYLHSVLIVTAVVLLCWALLVWPEKRDRPEGAQV